MTLIFCMILFSNYNFNKRKELSIQVREQVQNQEYSLRYQSAITFEDISEFIYNSLLSLEGTNEQYESDSSELYINFDIRLSQDSNELALDNINEYYKTLDNLWLYLWKEWYSYNKWVLWAKAADSKISYIKTTMIIELHWRHVRQNNNYPIIGIHEDENYKLFNFQNDNNAIMNIPIYYNSIEINEDNLESDNEEEDLNNF
ncbi:7321_t:CDS:2 [Dentiscutata erythropus]|uniref:7321_t:CDS:1 n=1 Tax=Dentiscutata erythropus TaxID=1348616 RepID=A0A9N9HI70_9GLOM|nr:7321_t:CDS:2 [Dentiscutata erythropus]